jgi:hypothetical protein
MWRIAGRDRAPTQAYSALPGACIKLSISQGKDKIAECVLQVQLEQTCPTSDILSNRGDLLLPKMR